MQRLTKKQILENERMHRQRLEAEQLVGYWAKKFVGITKGDLYNHPQISDVIFLLQIRDSIGKYFNNKESGMWGFCWSWCYHKQYPLKKKHLKKLETLATGIDHRLQQQALARTKIKAIKG